MAQPAGEAESDALGLAFDGRLELEFHSSSVTSGAGLLVDRELDDRLMAIAGQYLVSRRARATSIQRTAGRTRSNRSWPATARAIFAEPPVPMSPSPTPKSTSSW